MKRQNIEVPTLISPELDKLTSSLGTTIFWVLLVLESLMTAWTQTQAMLGAPWAAATNSNQPWLSSTSGSSKLPKTQSINDQLASFQSSRIPSSNSSSLQITMTLLIWTAANSKPMKILNLRLQLHTTKKLSRNCRSQLKTQAQFSADFHPRPTSFKPTSSCTMLTEARFRHQNSTHCIGLRPEASLTSGTRLMFSIHLECRLVEFKRYRQSTRVFLKETKACGAEIPKIKTNTATQMK